MLLFALWLSWLLHSDVPLLMPHRVISERRSLGCVLCGWELRHHEPYDCSQRYLRLRAHVFRCALKREEWAACGLRSRGYSSGADSPLLYALCAPHYLHVPRPVTTSFAR
ncbi:uncharacterized protein [Physcomitrium patens]|uniref:uncharacterized protein n=1 Tax=Physcomitrium patens TaxID=3218 RepID=UPI003CCD3A62